VTPETKRTVEEAMVTGDRLVLELYGRFLDPILQRISAESPSKASQVEQFRQNMPGGLTQ